MSLFGATRVRPSASQCYTDFLFIFYFFSLTQFFEVSKELEKLLSWKELGLQTLGYLCEILR